jgi:tRNA G18 (ribose-2'-O)-methylase SpoU
MSDITYDNSGTLSQHYFDNKSVLYNNEIAPIIIALDLRTPMNIGGIIRLAGNLGCKKVLFTGDENHFRKAKIRRTATTGFGHVDWEFCEHHQWQNKIPDDYQIVAVETIAEATSIFETKLIGKYAFVLGNERYGIDNKSLKSCQAAVYIPMPGIVKSMNVVQAANVVLFEWLRQNMG